MLRSMTLIICILKLTFNVGVKNFDFDEPFNYED